MVAESKTGGQWRLVPVEPSPLGEMSDPMVEIKMLNGETVRIAGEDVIVSGLWDAMLNAAPEPDDAVVERVARALWLHDHAHLGEVHPDNVPWYHRENAARAAINAISEREPN